MTNEMTYKCPNCNKSTFGVNKKFNNHIICPECLKKGITVVMIESTDQMNSSYIGDGFFKTTEK
jgi:DNA-directed RNA polymerase subunit RPC12/RpoP